jgi:hypothetical protein
MPGVASGPTPTWSLPMKVRSLLLASLALTAAPLAAQGGGQGGQRAGGGRGMQAALPALDTLTAQLTLTEAQQPKVAELMASYTAATKQSQEFVTKMMAEGGMATMRDNPEAMAHMTALREGRAKFVTDLKAMLTAEQVATYDKLYPARQGRRPAGG